MESREAIDHLFVTMREALTLPAVVIAGTLVIARTQDETELAREFAAMLRRLVRLVSMHPELNRIMVHEATSPGPRLEWLTEHHVRPCFNGLRPVWKKLVKAGIAAPIDDRLTHYVLIGASPLVFVNALELSALVSESPTSKKWLKRHADGLVAMLLPGLQVIKTQPGP
jgi:TetR/AcrR family transcriptional regulator